MRTSAYARLSESIMDAKNSKLCPIQLSSVLGIGVSEIIEHANQSKSPNSTVRINRSLQLHLDELITVLAEAEEIAGNRGRAVCWFMSERIPSLDNLSAYELVCIGKAQAVLDYIDSISGSP